MWTAWTPVQSTRSTWPTTHLLPHLALSGYTHLCKRTGEAEGGKIILQYLPHELIDQYFTDTTEPEPEPEPEEPTET